MLTRSLEGLGMPVLWSSPSRIFQRNALWVAHVPVDDAAV